MAAPKGKEKLNGLFDKIITEISEEGKSALSAIKGKMSTATFYELIKDEKKLNRYARAIEIRADKMAEEMLEIADNYEHDVIKDKDGKEIIDHAVVNRDRLRVDSRKWLLAKLHPKKYGDKIDMTSGNEKLPGNVNINVTSKENAEKLKEFLDGKSN